MITYTSYTAYLHKGTNRHTQKSKKNSILGLSYPEKSLIS